jgi:hypothetical protein
VVLICCHQNFHDLRLSTNKSFNRNFCKLAALKKLVAIFLLLQIITNNAFAEELVKIPKLFTHYHHHAHEHKDTKGFLDFLHKHYFIVGQEDMHSKNHNDEDNDCQLPFKHCGGCSVNVHAPVTVFVPTYLSTVFTCFEIKKAAFAFENERIESLNIRTIWQPPKFI